MNKSYSIIKNIFDNPYSDTHQNIEDIINLLNQKGIKQRQDDGVLRQINLSIPESLKYSFVIGLRYLKRDGKFTEDHFLCHKESSGLKKLEIEPHYKGRLEYKLHEYKGTHKKQIDFGQVFHSNYQINIDKKFTDVSTVSFILS